MIPTRRGSELGIFVAGMISSFPLTIRQKEILEEIQERLLNSPDPEPPYKNAVGSTQNNPPGSSKTGFFNRLFRRSFRVPSQRFVPSLKRGYSLFKGNKSSFTGRVNEVNEDTISEAK